VTTLILIFPFLCAHRDEPKKGHKVQHESERNKQCEEMNIIMEVLIKESMRERKLLGPTGMGATRGCGACCSLRLLIYVYSYKDDMQSD